jgi:fido (protein-threonine AMPylation protein)
MTAPKNIDSQMSELLGWYERLSSVEFNQIVEFHVRFERIHPFDDGNGRIGRLLMFKECLRWGVSPFILDDKRRSRYLSGLRSWDYDHADLLSICYEAQQRFARQITAQKAGEEHHKQLVRMGFYKRKHCLEDTLD